MRILIIILTLFLSSCTKAQLYFPAIVSGGSGFVSLEIGDANTTRFKGSNLRMPTGYTPYEWDNYYSNLETLFPVWVSKTMDSLKSNGCNVVRIIGDYQAVTRNVMTLSVYLAKYEMMIDTARAKGLHVYACAGDGNHIKKPDLTLAPLSELTPIAVAFSEMCETKDNVIGIDLVQEINGWPDAAGNIGQGTDATKINVAQTLYNAVKAAGVTKPLTFSFAHFSNTYNSDVIVGVEPYCDYLDFHQYFWPWSPSTMTGAYIYGKPVIIGETGMSWTSSDKDDLFQVLVDEQFTMPLYEGVLTWHAADNNTPESDQWGLWRINEDNTLTPYSTLHNFIFRQIPTTP